MEINNLSTRLALCEQALTIVLERIDYQQEAILKIIEITKERLEKHECILEELIKGMQAEKQILESNTNTIEILTAGVEGLKKNQEHFVSLATAAIRLLPDSQKQCLRQEIDTVNKINNLNKLYKKE